MQEIGLPEVIGIVKRIAVNGWWSGLPEALLDEIS